MTDGDAHIKLSDVRIHPHIGDPAISQPGHKSVIEAGITKGRLNFGFENQEQFDCLGIASRQTTDGVREYHHETLTKGIVFGNSNRHTLILKYG